MASPKQQRIDPASVPAPSKKAGSTKKPGARKPKVVPPSARKAKRASLGDWISAARLLTLPLSIAPVLLGAAIAFVYPRAEGDLVGFWILAAACLAVAVFLQIGVNYANDYSDGVRGTDDDRVGPARLTASGAARPRTVLTVALVFFALAAAAGVFIVIRTEHWWLLAVGAVAILAAWFYTGGKRPYGYFALGELVAFLFFGIVATAGTVFVLANDIPFETWIAAASIGAIAAAALLVNNIRDREKDAVVSKRTLAVLIGDRASRILYAFLIIVPPLAATVFFSLVFEMSYLAYFALLAAVPAAVITLFARTPGELVIALRLTSLTALLYALGLGYGIAF
ncbi:1,4-dihydroxy-2-naphthoate octaprenyltransferase [Microbacteriaceae bacterium SG_E_30_P1]|uniref:1,4-dihydroxy-2-naphthoate octaprenyltransferase n=1 Tax=Antiquaquibacter oligotrophicus TaxID=2880260 RepID=A0ABT6KRA8_9MICO|nr:1,4-dihydroxy-2-naphthoate polyprenyltransferase [Antiquaquibacter oligotrophicus]MDH6182018.1 1,4-dihydroxy-2-naphthoate octaprenyltransferase [Antiquaquibacter oligotrophicus]UDF12314.1 1,4-dihydroxy-2-naphthoate polyprenyltransferase [Antiquaquibacter oligotrophicus]